MSNLIPQSLRGTQNFASTLLRLSFGLLFLLVAIKKLRMGYGGFAESLIMGDTLLAKDAPPILLLSYGLLLPGLELFIGVALLLDYHVRDAYVVIGIIYLSFIFGSMYNGNTVKIGTEYFPSILALIAAHHFYEKG